MKVVVVGGGIGGLGATVALAGAGAEVELFERAPRIEQVGAGIGLAPNALRCLELLGVLDTVRLHGNIAGEVVHRTDRGKVLARGEDGSLWIHRADLQSALLDAIDPKTITLDATFVSSDEDASGITARFSNGTKVLCDLLIGADGIRSAVRSQLFGPSEPDYSGVIAWRGVTRFSHTCLAYNTEIWGRGSRFGIFPIGNGRVYWYGTRRKQRGFVLEPGNRRESLLREFEGWVEPVERLIESTPEEAIVQTDLFDRRPIPNWGVGRVILLGDAAHPMTADLGQGCAQVLEDAVSIGSSFVAEKGPDRLLAAYKGARIQRANSVLRQTHRQNRLGHTNSRLVCLIRNEVMLKRTPERVRERRERKLLGLSP